MKSKSIYNLIIKRGIILLITLGLAIYCLTIISSIPLFILGLVVIAIGVFTTINDVESMDETEDLTNE